MSSHTVPGYDTIPLRSLFLAMWTREVWNLDLSWTRKLLAYKLGTIEFHTVILQMKSVSLLQWEISGRICLIILFYFVSY